MPLKELKVAKINELTALFKALSDINRVRIIALIAREGSVCVCELCDTLGLSQPLVSRHLKQLKDTGILVSHKEGKWTIYTLNANADAFLKCVIDEIHSAETTLPPLCACKRC